MRDIEYLFLARDLVLPSFARRSGLRTRVRPLAGPSTGSGGKSVPIPDQVRDRLFRDNALADPERFELAVQRRALHADELGSARDVAAETADLRHQIFALKHFARIAQRQSHQVFTPIACLLYTSDAADDLTRVDLGGR